MKLACFRVQTPSTCIRIADKLQGTRCLEDLWGRKDMYYGTNDYDHLYADCLEY